MTFETQIEPVARELRGDPNAHLSKPDNLRFGTHGSLSVKPSDNTWFDHEADTGGGVLDLIVHLGAATDRGSARKWLVDKGFLAAETTPPAIPLSEYQYLSADGELLYEVVRKPGKKFVQRRPDGNGGWIWNLKGVARVLYRLPHLLAAPAALVFIVEGGKDVHTLEALGMVATTNSGGAGKWHDSYSAALQGRNVVILPDNDEAGRDHARQVKKALAGVASSVRVVALPDLAVKGDVTDWIQAGHTADELMALVNSTTISVDQADSAGTAAAPTASWEANVIQAATITPQPINWLWPTWLATGKLTILAGAAGTGKTTLALGLATLTSAGKWPDGQRRDSPGNVIIWSSEDDPADTLIPRLMAMGADLQRVYMIQGKINDQGEREPFDPASDMDLLKLAAARMGGVSLLMIDPIVSAIKGDMHKANEVRRGLQAVVDFAAEQKAAILGISHFAKGTKGCDPQERVIGSQAFAALARMVLVAAKQEDSDMRVLARAKSNIAVDDGGIEYGIQAATLDSGIETTRAYWGGKIDGSAREILGAVEHTEPAAGNSEIDDAEVFLEDMLKDGLLPAKQLQSDAIGAGHTQATIRRAKKKMGVISYREGGSIGEESRWFWKPPEVSDLPNILKQTPKVLSLGSEHLRESVCTLGEQPVMADGMEVI